MELLAVVDDTESILFEASEDLNNDPVPVELKSHSLASSNLALASN